jgi:hypothetical protein
MYTLIYKNKNKMRIRRTARINSQEATRYAQAIACQHARNMSTRKNLKGISDEAQSIIDAFKKNGDTKFDMDEFNALSEDADVDEKMIVATSLVSKKDKKKYYYRLQECEKRINDSENKLIDLMFDDEMTLKQIVNSSNRIDDAIEYLKIHQQKAKDEKAIENLSPLSDWYKNNESNRAKVMLSNKINELKNEIEKVGKKIATETDNYFKSLFDEKLNSLKKDIKRKKNEFAKKFNQDINDFLKGETEDKDDSSGSESSDLDNSDGEDDDHDDNEDNNNDEDDEELITAPRELITPPKKKKRKHGSSKKKRKKHEDI